MKGGINTFAYANADPVNMADANGLKASVGTCLAACASDQMGLPDLFAAGGLGVTADVIPKGMVTPGATGRTSIWSSTVGSYGKMGRSVWAPTRNNFFARTAKFGRFVGRWIPIVSTAILAYDAIQIAMCTKKCTEETCER